MYNFIRFVYWKLPESLRLWCRGFIPALLPFISLKVRLWRNWIRDYYQPFHSGQREELLLSVARFCHANRPIKGYYFEFGCHSGYTMSLAWKHTQHLFNWTYVGFDSFEGLPEIEPKDDQEIWVKGKLATSEEKFIELVTQAGMPSDRLVTVKGFYEDTLNKSLTAKLGHQKAAATYSDCDSSSSTVPILKFIKPFLQIGTVIIFDDWYCFHGDPLRGERRAWQEFLNENPSLRFSEFVKTCEANSFIYLGDEKDRQRIENLYADS